MVVRMRMGVGLVRPAVRRPARVSNPDGAFQRLPGEAQFEVLELALGPPARQPPALERGNAGGVIAAIFEPLEGIDHLAGDRLVPENSDDSAHRAWMSFASPSAGSPQRCKRGPQVPEITKHCVEFQPALGMLNRTVRLSFCSPRHVLASAARLLP